MVEVTKEMTDKFNEENKSATELDQPAKDEVKKKYLEFLGIDENYREKDYDSELILVGDYGRVVDDNLISNILKSAGRLWGIIIAIIVIMYAVMSFIPPNLFLSIFILLLVLGILIMLFIGAIDFHDKLKSTRDTKYKLISSITILPLLIVILYLIFTVGIVGTGLLIVVFLVLAGLGALFILLMKH